MSQVIICIYDKANALTDSITIACDHSEMAERVITPASQLGGPEVRINTLGNIISMHVDADNGGTVDYSIRLKEILTGENVERIAEAWCRLTDAKDDQWRVARVGTQGLVVNLQTLGGWSTFTVADVRNKTEMAELKQWTLEKAGLMAGQGRENTRAIHASHLTTAGLNFLGHVTSKSELENSWPRSAFVAGSAWLDPTQLHVCLREGEPVQSYLRSEVGAPERAKSLITDEVPAMPLKAKPATRWMDIDIWRADSRAQGINIDLLSMQLRELTFVDGEDAPSHHGILHNAEVVIEVDPTRAGGFNVWVDGEGYPATGHDGLANGQLLEIDERLNPRLSLSQLPTDLFQCIYSFSSYDAVRYAQEHLTHRAIMVVTQYELVFVDTTKDVLVIDRSTASAEDVYTALLRRYPMLAGGIAASTFTKLYPVLTDYSIATSGPMQEALTFRAESGETNSFLLCDWAGINQWVATLSAPVRRRGETSVFQHMDELGFVEPGMAEAKALVEQVTDKVTNALDGLRSRRGEVNAPQMDVAETKAPVKQIQHAVLVPADQPVKIEPETKVYEAQSTTERAISIPVLGTSGETLYRANFIFENELVYGTAVDVGFAAQVASGLGQRGFRGFFEAGPRIAEIGLIAEDLFQSMGLAGNFRYERN